MENAIKYACNMYVHNITYLKMFPDLIVQYITKTTQEKI